MTRFVIRGNQVKVEHATLSIRRRIPIDKNYFPYLLILVSWISYFPYGTEYCCTSNVKRKKRFFNSYDIQNL